MRRPFDEIAEEERRLADAEARAVGEEQRAEQRQGDADRADHEVLPGRFQRPLVLVEVEEHCGRKRRRLHGHPQDGEVLGQRDETGHGQEEEQRRAEDPVRPFRPQAEIPDAVERTDTEEGRHHEKHQPAEGIETEPLRRQPNVAVRDHRRRKRQVKHPHDGHDPRPRTIRRQQERGQRAEERNDDEIDGHPYSLRRDRRSVSSEENSRWMWLRTIPMTKMPTRRSRRTPTSTIID